jgi:putative spermidine/putrescine transport system permease protein
VLLRAFSYLMAAFLLLPMAVLVAGSFTTVSYVAFPPQGFTFKWYGEALRRTEFLDSLKLSVIVAVVTSAIAMVLGTLVALGIVRYRFKGREAVNAFFMSPLVLPTIVIGIALLQFYNRVGLATGVLTLVIGHVIVTVPYAIRLVAASLTGLDRNVELAARTLGAPPVLAFLKVTLPLIAPGVVAGAVFSFITSFDNVTISIFLATPRMVTLPVRIYNFWDQPIVPWLLAICSLIIVWTIAVIWIIERTISVQGIFGVQRTP